MQTKTLSLLVGLAVALGAIGLAVFFALSGEGQIDVKDRIITTDQTEFAQEVLPEARAIVPNGGLNPRGNVPEPVSPQLEEVPADGESGGGEETPADGATVESSAEAEASEEGDVPTP